jgi:hypothetical protein
MQLPAKNALQHGEHDEPNPTSASSTSKRVDIHYSLRHLGLPNTKLQRASFGSGAGSLRHQPPGCRQRPTARASSAFDMFDRPLTFFRLASSYS